MSASVAPLASAGADAAPTPSETVLFGASHFSKRGLLPAGNDAPYDGAEKVGVDHLARAMLKAAILGGERAGTLRLELRQSKALFGLMTKTSLMLVGAADPAWPKGSLEAALGADLRGREMEAGAWLYAHLREDSASPERAIVDEVRVGLGGRHALDAAETRRLGFVTGVRWTLTEAGKQVRDAARPEEIEALFAACERERPEIWKALDRAVSGALTRRTVQNNSGPDVSSD